MDGDGVIKGVPAVETEDGCEVVVLGGGPMCEGAGWGLWWSRGQWRPFQATVVTVL